MQTRQAKTSGQTKGQAGALCKNATKCGTGTVSIGSDNTDTAFLMRDGNDPELLYAECGLCGAPVMWGEGCATALMREAGIDPFELDSSCFFVTEGCPRCCGGGQYNVHIYRVCSVAGHDHPTLCGTA